MNLLQRIARYEQKKKAEDERMCLLAVELGLAGGEILKERYGFTERQVADWLDLMLNRAKINRARTYAQIAIKAIDDPQRER